jgi:hypothetical protein
MKLAIGGVCANLLGVVGIYFNAIEVSEEFAMNFTLFALAFWALSAFGLILMATGKRKLGGVLTIIGAVLFVPLGIIAILGARSAMNNGQSKDLDERRRLASTTSDSSG